MSNFVKQEEHERKKPVTVERDIPDYLIIEGVRFAGDVFRAFGAPNEQYLYALRRDGDTVVLTTIHNAAEARAYFQKVKKVNDGTDQVS